VEEVSTSGCNGWSNEGRPPRLFSLAKSWTTNDSRCLSMWEDRSFVMSYFRASVLASMVECMEESMVDILALFCCNSF
jgi:hypothetical protein